MSALIDIGIGLLVGGLAVSTAWGMFWFAIGLIGLNRNTCGWDIVTKGFAGWCVPCSLLLGLLWWRGDSGDVGVWFASGLAGIPALLVLLSLRSMPDGKMAGSHLVEGIRALQAELLRAQRGCGGCHPEHDHESCG
ncbi:MAG: hypothetical protein AB7P24_05275 [Nitrospira sp.]